MSEERFNQGMDELKKKYEEVPYTTSAKKIIEAVQEDQKGKRIVKRRNVYWAPLAAGLAVLLIGGILIQSFISSDGELGSGDVSDNNNQSIHEDPPNQEVENNENNRDEPIDKDVEEPPAFHVDRPSQVTYTEWPEGMPEDVTYDLFVSESLRFSTYVSRAFDASLSESENIVGFAKEYIEMELVMLPPEVASRPKEDLINEMKQNLIDRGFVVIDDGREAMFQNLLHQGYLFHEGEELISYYAVLENDNTGDVYIYTAEMPTIAQEGTFYPGIQRFIDEIEFY